MKSKNVFLLGIVLTGGLFAFPPPAIFQTSKKVISKVAGEVTQSISISNVNLTAKSILLPAPELTELEVEEQIAITTDKGLVFGLRKYIVDNPHAGSSEVTGINIMDLYSKLNSELSEKGLNRVITNLPLQLRLNYETQKTLYAVRWGSTGGLVKCYTQEVSSFSPFQIGNDVFMQSSGLLKTENLSFDACKEL